MSAWLQAPDKFLGISPFAAAHKVDDMWAWFEQSGNEMRRNRFTGVMKTMNDASWKEDLFTDGEGTCLPVLLEAGADWYLSGRMGRVPRHRDRG